MHLSPVGGGLSGQDTEQRCLTSAVNPYDCGFFPFFYMKCDIFQYGVYAIGFLDLLQCQYHFQTLRLYCVVFLHDNRKNVRKKELLLTIK